MPIHDEVLLEVVNRLDHFVEGKRMPQFVLMRTQYVLMHDRSNDWQRICPDISVYPEGGPNIAIEIESDASFDFDRSIRQIKNYSTPNTRLYEKKIVVIPEFYRKFAPLYLHERIGVYIWSGKREWTCLQCGNKQIDERMIKPNKCTDKECNSNQLTLSGLKDFQLRELG